MPTADKKQAAKVEAREAVVVTVGARPIEWQRRIVRDRHSGRLVEIDIHELPPVDEGDEGMFYTFRRGEKVWRDHPAVLTSPGSFVEIADDD